MRIRALWSVLLVLGLVDWLAINLVVGPLYLTTIEASVVDPAPVEQVEPEPAREPVEEEAILLAELVPIAMEPEKKEPVEVVEEPAEVVEEPAEVVEEPVVVAAVDVKEEKKAEEVEPERPLELVVVRTPSEPERPKEVERVVEPVKEPEVRAPVRPRLDTVVFAIGSTELSEQGKTMLRRLGRYMQENPKASVLIEGHSCDVGSEQANEWYSQQRAQSVERYLEALGVGADRIEVESYGSTRPVDPSKTAAARVRNRRVELTVR